MYFSSQLLRGLIIELARVQQLDKEALQNLIYHLKLPGEAVPNFIATIIAERPNIGTRPNLLPGRLAYGIVDDTLDFLDVSQRYNLQAKLCRQVERIRWGLQKREHPVKLIDAFEENL